MVGPVLLTHRSNLESAYSLANLWAPSRGKLNQEQAASWAMPDLELVTSPNKASFHCHKVVLASRCPYFRRALLSGMKEAISGYSELFLLCG